MSNATHADQEMTATDDDRTITLDAAGEVHVPVVELLTGRGFITGKSGSGKSNTASVVVEELLDQGFPVLIVDTDGEYFGLKEEYELLHAGADEDCDIQVGPEHAEKLATLALEENVPVILDVSGYLDEDEADDLVRETARHLYAKEKQLQKPFLLIVEEVHEYLPQQGSTDDTGQMLVKIGKRGRKRGLGIVGISQRPADVKKDFITQANWLVWHRLTWDNDTTVVRRVVSSEVAEAVEDLGDGEGFLQTDWTEADVQRVQFRRKRTFDAGATPGLDDVERPELKSVGEGLLDELSEISERADRRRDRVDELEQKLDERDERIAELEQELTNARDVSNAAQQLASALQGDDEGAEAGVPEDFDEQLQQKNEEIHELQARVDDLEAALEERDERIAEQQSELERLESYEDRVEEAERIEERLEAVKAWFASAPEELLATNRQAQALFDEVGDDSDADVAALQQRVDELEAENERLEQQVKDAGGVYVPTDYEAFLEDDTVREQVAEAKTSSSVSEDYVRAIVAAILEAGGPVSFEEILEFPNATSKNHVGRAANELADRRIVSIDERDGGRYVDFNVDGVEAIKTEAKRRERREDLMEGL